MSHASKVLKSFKSLAFVDDSGKIDNYFVIELLDSWVAAGLLAVAQNVESETTNYTFEDSSVLSWNNSQLQAIDS